MKYLIALLAASSALFAASEYYYQHHITLSGEYHARLKTPTNTQLLEAHIDKESFTTTLYLNSQDLNDTAVFHSEGQFSGFSAGEYHYQADVTLVQKSALKDLTAGENYKNMLNRLGEENGRVKLIYRDKKMLIAEMAQTGHIYLFTNEK